MQLDLQGAESFWLKFNDGTVELGSGKLEGANTVLTLAGDTAAAVFTGEKDATAAYTAGQLSVEGDLPDAIKLRTIIEIVREEIEE
jgi:putative sterol carrier protein